MSELNATQFQVAKVVERIARSCPLLEDIVEVEPTVYDGIRMTWLSIEHTTHQFEVTARDIEAAGTGYVEAKEQVEEAAKFIMKRMMPAADVQGKVKSTPQEDARQGSIIMSDAGVPQSVKRMVAEVMEKKDEGEMG